MFSSSSDDPKLAVWTQLSFPVPTTAEHVFLICMLHLGDIAAKMGDKRGFWALDKIREWSVVIASRLSSFLILF